MLRLRVVLVRTFSPGNLGACARAAKNFGAELVLLDPRADRSHPDALEHASGAGDLLLAARVARSWDEAVDGTAGAVALTSLRGRRGSGLPPRLSFAGARAAATGDTSLALVFGPERSGLTTDEVRRATGRLSLPSSPDFPTLNVAQAVAATLAVLHAGRSRGAAPAGGPPAGTGDLGRLRDALRAALDASGFRRGPGDDGAVAELLGPLLRARPSRREATLWTGVLRALGRARPAG